MASQKSGTPFIAKVQKAPDPVWDFVLAKLDEVRECYDSETQTAGIRAEASSNRAATSGGSVRMPDDGKSTTPDRGTSYRSMTSGGASKFIDDGKGTQPDA